MDGRSETQRTDADGRDARAVRVRTAHTGTEAGRKRKRGAVLATAGDWDLGPRSSEEIYVPCVFMYRSRWQDVALEMEIN